MALVIAVTLSGALAASIGLMTHLWYQPDEVDFGALAPWLAGGIAAGTLLWLILDPAHGGRRSKSRRRHSRRSTVETR